MDTPTGLPTTPIELSQAFGIDPRKTGPTDAAQAATLAQEFEAMLMLQMVRQMRQSLLSEEDQEQGLGNDRWTETFDVEFSRFLAQKGGLGLASFVRQQLAAQAPDTDAAPGEASRSDAAPNAATPRTAIAAAVTPRAIASAVAAATNASVSAALVPDLAAPDAAASLSAASVGSNAIASSTAGAPYAPASAPPFEPAREEEPLTLPLDSVTTSRFGWRGDPFHGRRRFHSGVDLRAAYGTDVPAAGAGRVTFAGERGAYGTLVIVQHEDGVETRYAHLSATEVKAGDRVDAGQIIGRVGSTGRSTAPHLHFEVLVNGARVDPELVAARNPDTFKFGRPVVD